MRVQTAASRGRAERFGVRGCWEEAARVAGSGRGRPLSSGSRWECRLTVRQALGGIVGRRMQQLGGGEVRGRESRGESWTLACPRAGGLTHLQLLHRRRAPPPVNWCGDLSGRAFTQRGIFIYIAVLAVTSTAVYPSTALWHDHAVCWRREY